MPPTANLLQLSLNAATFISVTSILSLAIFAHKRSLIPLYGSGPTAYLLDWVVLGAAAAASIHTINVSLKRNLLYTAIAFTLAPNATYWIGVWTSREKQPILGPAITHATALGPLVFLLTTFLVQSSNSQSNKQKASLGRTSIIFRLIRGGATYMAAILLNNHVLSTQPILYNISDSQICLACAPIFYALWILSLTFVPAPLKPALNKKKPQAKEEDSPQITDMQIKSYIFLAFSFIWVTISPRLANPILPHPLTNIYTHPTYPLQVLSAEQSVTGLITVAEWLPPADSSGEHDNDQQLHSARYLRASHSILGGVWTHGKVGVLDNEPPLTDSLGTPLGDSIYSTFVVQEAARLVNSTDVGKANAWKNTLVIGLGTGISTTSFMRHGISTTIVEIDPAVYRAARTFFGLPDPGPGKVFLEDARTWASKQHAVIDAGNKTTLFDIVVHDCFSGGGVPQHIFTMEFWADLKTVMVPEGILVVNFAGVLRSDSSRLVINTLEKSFKQCRAFHDMFDTLDEEKYDTEFINMVLFCTQSTVPLTFRKSRRSDWLGSPLRRHVLRSLESREVDLDLIRGTKGSDQRVLTDGHNALGALQEKQGGHHWLVMREVLPDVHWETY